MIVLARKLTGKRSWAFWKREHKGNTGLDNINKFLVHDIINTDTEKLIKQALLSYQVPDGGERYEFVPKWPGLVFSIDSDEGKAMLGKYTPSSEICC